MHKKRSLIKITSTPILRDIFPTPFGPLSIQFSMLLRTSIQYTGEKNL